MIDEFDREQDLTGNAAPGLGTGERQTIPAATETAVWVLSNGRCYYPGCPFP